MCDQLPYLAIVAPQGYNYNYKPLWENAGKSGGDRSIVRATVHKLKRESGNNLCGRFDHYKNGNQPFQLVNAVECMSVK